MRNLLLLLLVAALLPMSVVAQEVQSNWEFDGPFPADLDHIVHQHFGVQGLEVDNNNRVWVLSHYTRELTDVEGYEGPNRVQIRIFNEDGSETDFSPIWSLTFGDSTHVWASGAGRGMRLDAAGNILASLGNTLYRINAETGEGMDYLQLAALGPLTSVGVADDGSIMIPAVLGDRALPIYSADMVNFITNVAEERPGIARSAEFSADGTRAYIPLLGGDGGYVLTYESDFGVLGTYAPVDPIVIGVHAEAIGISRATDLLWVSAGNPSDGINTMQGEPTETNWELGYYYGFDQETGELVDYFQWDDYENEPVRPRGIAFSPDGQYAYVATFEAAGPGVQRFRYTATTSNESEIVPASFELDQNYPNPFNPTTRIEYTVREAGQVSLKVYDMLGREVATLQSGVLAPGQYNATFDAQHLSSGTYLYVLEAGGQRITRSMVLLK